MVKIAGGIIIAVFILVAGAILFGLYLIGFAWKGPRGYLMMASSAVILILLFEWVFG
jgi:hypothetical protein